MCTFKVPKTKAKIKLVLFERTVKMMKKMNFPFSFSTGRCLDHCFRSFPSRFQSISIDQKTLEHCMERNYFVFQTLYLLPFLATVSRPQGLFDSFHKHFKNYLLSNNKTFGFRPGTSIPILYLFSHQDRT